MSLASANKDQMKVWKSAAKAMKDGEPESPRTKVMLHVRTAEMGMFATLTASNGYQLMQRHITVDDGYHEGNGPVQIAIPSEAIKAAEKLTPKKGGRALFFENKIEVHEILLNEDTLDETDRLIANVPFIVQEDLFKDWDDVLQRSAKEDMPEKIIQIEASLFKPVIEQLKSGDANVFVTLRMRGESEALILTAFEDVEEEEIRAVIMPIGR